MTIRPPDVKHLKPSAELLEAVDKLLTPQELLKRVEFDLPRAIHPNTHRNFNALLLHRHDIRDLKLVPIKDDKVHDHYNSIRDDPKLVTDIRDLLGAEELVIAENKYPYHLPPDVHQDIIWVSSFELPRKKLVRFISKVMLARELDTYDVILFERPVRNKSKLVKGTFPAYRHVHFWYRGWLAKDVYI